MPTRVSLTSTEQTQLRVMADLQQMFGELRLNEELNELVREINAAILRSALSPQRVLDLIVEKCLSRTEANHGQVVLYRHGRLVVAASTNPAHVGEELPLANSLCGKAVQERVDQHYPDVSVLPPTSFVQYRESTKSELVVLIQPANEDRVLGVIDLQRDVEGPFPQAALAFAHLLAGQAAIAIEHARTGTGIKALYEISNAAASGMLTLQQNCQEILTALLSNLDVEHGQILVREGENLLIVASSVGEDIGLRLGPGSSVTGRYLLTEHGRAPLVIADIENSTYHDAYFNLSGGSGQPMRSEVILPLLGESGTLIGAINIESPSVKGFTGPDENFLGAVANFLAGAIAAALARQRRTQDEQSRIASLAMTQLGNAAQSFLHRFGSAIGNARLRLIELGDHLATLELPPLPHAASIDEFIHGMVDSLGEAGRVIQDFHYRFNPGRAEFQAHAVDLALTGEELIQKYNAKYANSGIEFLFENKLRAVEHDGNVPAHSKAVCRLTDEVNEVIENLLDNAVQAVTDRSSGPHGGLVTVTVRLNGALGVQLRVTDNGIGIPEENQRSILDFGFSTRRERGAQGIGLWFCQLYVFQLGGKLTFESEAGKGSWFGIDFPAMEA